MLNHQNAVVLIHLSNGNALAWIYNGAFFQPFGAQWKISLDHGTSDRRSIADVKQQSAAMEWRKLRRDCGVINNNVMLKEWGLVGILVIRS